MRCSVKYRKTDNNPEDDVGKDILKLESQNKHEIKLADNETLVARVLLAGYEEFTKNLFKPFDGIFAASLLTTALESAFLTTGCRLVYVTDRSIIFLIKPDDGYSSWSLNDQDTIVTKLTSRISRLFNKYYVETVNNARQRVDDTDLQLEVYERMYFKAEFEAVVYTVEDNQLNDVLTIMQKQLKHNSILSFVKNFFSMGDIDDTVLDNKAILDGLINKCQEHWLEFPSLYRLGSVYYSDGNWKLDSDIPDFSCNKSYIYERSRITA